MKKIVALLSGIMMVIALVGCGNSGGNDSSGGGSGDAAPAVEGAVEEFGNFSVFIPDGYVLNGGDYFDSENADALTVQNEDEVFIYVMLSINDEDMIDDGMEWTKEFNSDCEFEDAAYDLANGSFAGFSYDSSGIICMELKAEMGGKFVQVTSAGLATDDAVLKAILESITIK